MLKLKLKFKLKIKLKPKPKPKPTTQTHTQTCRLRLRLRLRLKRAMSNSLNSRIRCIVWSWGLTASSSYNLRLFRAKHEQNVKIRVPFSKPVCSLYECPVTLALPKQTSCKGSLKCFQRKNYITHAASNWIVTRINVQPHTQLHHVDIGKPKFTTLMLVVQLTR